MTGETRVPTSPDELTAEWMTEALRAGRVLDRARVTKIEPKVVGVGSGFIGQVARVSLAYDFEESAPRSLFAKFPGASEGGRAAGHAFDFYHREIRFYRELASAVCLRTPAHYFSAMDRREQRYVLLVEDLAPMQVGDQAKGWTPEQAGLAIEQIARLHARYWESPSLSAIGDWMPATNGPGQRLIPETYRKAWGPFIEMFGASLSSEFRGVGERIGRRGEEIQSSLAASPRTVTHGDFRLDNLFFGAVAGTEAFALVDWQIVSIGCGTFDVGYLLCSGAEPEQRSRYERALLRLYHRTLEENGVRDYPFERCWDDYRRSALYHFLYVVIGLGTIDPGNERGLSLFKSWLRRAVRAIEDLNAAALIAD